MTAPASVTPTEARIARLRAEYTVARVALVYRGLTDPAARDLLMERARAGHTFDTAQDAPTDELVERFVVAYVQRRA